VNTDSLGPDREGLNLEVLSLEESDHEEEDREEKDHDLQDTLYSPSRQGGAILHPKVNRMLPLPTRVQEQSVSGRIDPARQRPCHMHRVGPYVSDIQLQLRA